MQPLAHSLPPAVKAGGFLLTLGSVLAAHVLPLVWYLAADSSAIAVTPPLLTGVFVQQSASQQQTAAAVKPQQQQTTAEPAAVTPQAPTPQRQPVKPAAAQRPVKPAPQSNSVAVAEPPPSVAVAPVLTKTDSSTAVAVPVSAPVLNATAQYNAPPLYPRLSRKLREQGTVVLQLTVLASGKVADVTVQHSSGYPRLDKAALSAVQHWRYQPAQRGGEAIDHRYRQRVEFSLTEGVN
jgi:protein TonB